MDFWAGCFSNLCRVFETIRELCIVFIELPYEMINIIGDDNNNNNNNKLLACVSTVVIDFKANSAPGWVSFIQDQYLLIFPVGGRFMVLMMMMVMVMVTM